MEAPPPPLRFDFGANWKAFSSSALDHQALLDAQASLIELLGRESLQDKRFLDVGCGSGLFSIAAHLLGCRGVLGIDVNPSCVDVSLRNVQKFIPEAKDIRFEQKDILKRESFKNILGDFEIVYAWGSLHHTGDLWSAVKNTAECVAPGGLLVLGVYNRHWTSPFWNIIKKTYVSSHRFVQEILSRFFAAVLYAAKFAVTLKNPLKKDRGMRFYFDVVDWVGGYPYESASKEEVMRRLSGLGFECVRSMDPETPTGNNQFVFKKLVVP